MFCWHEMELILEFVAPWHAKIKYKNIIKSSYLILGATVPRTPKSIDFHTQSTQIFDENLMNLR